VVMPTDYSNLTIVRWIVDLHGGTVHAEPNQPSGARFIVTLPTT
jgi:signal transduction histidine kinase